MSTPSPTQESSLQIDLLAWLEINKGRIAAAFLIISILILGLLVYRWQSDRKETTASHALLATLKAGAREPLTPDAPSAPLLDLAQTFKGTQAGERALLLGAARLYTEGNYSEARQKFENFARQYPESAFVSTALMGSATSFDALNQTNEALSAYQAVITQFPNEPVASQAKLARARIYESSQPEQAIAIYEELSKGTANRMAGQMASIRRESLLGRFPDLARSATLTNTINVTAPLPTNAPVEVPATPPAATPAKAP